MPSSPPGIWVTDPAAYRRKMKDKLGGRDPLEIIASTPATIAKIVAVAISLTTGFIGGPVIGEVEGLGRGQLPYQVSRDAAIRMVH